MVLVQKWPFLHVFFLGNIGQENVFFDIQERKKASLGYKNKKFKKSKKFTFFQRGQPMVLVQKWPLFKFFYQPIRARKMSFMIFQNKKTTFQAIKTRSSKSQKIDIFPKGLTNGFGPKMAIFAPFFFLGNTFHDNVLMIFWNEKMPLQAIETRRSKRREIHIFPKGLTHDFGPKVAFFSSFLFGQNRPGKCLL